MEIIRHDYENNTVVFRVSRDMMAMIDHRYIRRSEIVTVSQPTAEEWADYEKAKEALAYLTESPYFEPGGPDYGNEVNPPEQKREYRYTETEDEWNARCDQLDKERQG